MDQVASRTRVFPAGMASGGNELVQRALDAAAARARRHAELNAAATCIERLLNIPLSREMLPWGSALCRYKS